MYDFPRVFCQPRSRGRTCAARNLTENAANVYIQDMADLVAVRDGITGPTFYPIYVLDLSTISYEK